MKLHFREIDYGFEYGAAQVRRYFSNAKEGWVVIGVTSQKAEVQIYITKTGKIRVHSDAGEWLPNKASKAKKPHSLMSPCDHDECPPNRCNQKGARK